MSTHRLGIDIGGTFTDLVLMNNQTGQMLSLKTPSVPDDPAQAVLNGIRELLQRESVAPEAITYFTHGTTLGVNTLIEHTGAPTGLLVTRGFEDLLIMGRLRLPNPNDYLGDKPKPLVHRQHVIGIDERLSADGSVYKRLNPEEVLAAANELVGSGVRAIAVCFLHSYRNSVHEQAAVTILREKFPDLYICGSSEIWPQLREYERATVSTVNAYLGLKLQAYFTQLEERLASHGLRATLLTTKSNGGVMSVHSAYQSPVETLLSGPAGGVMGAQQLGRIAGVEKVIALDMGGTSADVCVINEKVPYSVENEVGGLPVIMPAIDIWCIGAGGGSIAWADSAGVLKVGPRSAGASPGPACYGRGGKDATVTDAYVCLGIIDPDSFLGGTMVLQRGLAEESIGALGHSLGLGLVETAESVLRVATANMYAQLVPLTARKGIDPRDFTLVAYGGAGPTHAFMLAKEVGIRTVLVPPNPGTLCALGSLMADLRRDFIATVYRRLDDVEEEAIETVLGRLEGQALQWVSDQRVDLVSTTMTRALDLRYVGQSFELTVDLGVGSEVVRSALIAFHQLHQTAYGHADPNAPVEVINARVTVIGETHKPDLRSAFRSDSPSISAEAAAPAFRTLYYDGKEHQAQVYQRAALMPGKEYAGPLIVLQYDTTTFVPPGFRVTVDEWGIIRGEAVNHAS